MPIALDDWQATPDDAMRRDAVGGLERGDVVLFPTCPSRSRPTRAQLLDPAAVKDGTKTVKYDPDTGRVWGYADGRRRRGVKSMMTRYAEQTRRLLDALIPATARR